ncbi:hypothetical protein TorRG33x02_302650, partial [Trema orientale]
AGPGRPRYLGPARPAGHNDGQRAGPFGPAHFATSSQGIYIPHNYNASSLLV